MFFKLLQIQEVRRSIYLTLKICGICGLLIGLTNMIFSGHTGNFSQFNLQAFLQNLLITNTGMLEQILKSLIS